MMILAATELEFDAKVVKATAPVCVVLWAPWDGGSRLWLKVIDSLAGDYPSIRFVTFNTDESQDLCLQLRILNTPSTLLLKNGQELRRWMGPQRENELREQLSRLQEDWFDSDR